MDSCLVGNIFLVGNFLKQHYFFDAYTKKRMTTTHAYLRNGLDRLGNIPTYATLMPTAGVFTHIQKRLPRPPDQPYIQPIMNNAIQRPHTMKVLGKKSNHDLVHMVKPLIHPTAGITAPSFNVRHQRKGLAYDPQRAVGKLTPQVDNQYAGLNSTLPLPP
jgi:hypothetical protein